MEKGNDDFLCKRHDNHISKLMKIMPIYVSSQQSRTFFLFHFFPIYSEFKKNKKEFFKIKP